MLEKVTSTTKLLELYFLDKNIYRQNVDVGFAIGHVIRQLKKDGKINNASAIKFKSDARNFLATLCNHIVNKSPLQSHFARCTRALNPVNMVDTPESCKNLFDRMLQKLVEYKHIQPTIADGAKQELNVFLTFVVKENKSEFRNFDLNVSRLDVFFMRFLKDNNRYKNLLSVVKLIMTFAHGQSEVERGFSINEHLLADNMKMETLIAQRKVMDYMKKNNFQPHSLPIS